MISSIGILSFGDAFAEHVQYKTRDEMEKIDVKLIFVTSFDECTKNNWNSIEGYSIMTYYYLWKYNIVANTSIDCINKDRISFAVDNSLSSNDLTIIFPDILNSLDWLIAKNKLGHYTWNGNDRTIVTHALTLNADSESSIWTLSHELSHFALEWYDYPGYVFGNEVHKAQDNYDDCMWNDPTGAMCRNLWELLESVVTEDVGKTMGVKYRVMEPLRSDRYVSPPTYTQPTYTQPTTPTLKDYDRDGIADVYDACPFDNANDSDRDGICGNVDKCPYDAGVASNSGCPAPKPTIRPEIKSPPSTPPLDRVSRDNFRVLDNNLSLMSSNDIRVSKQIHLALDIKNTQGIEQPFAYLVQIQNSNGKTVSLSWITGSLSAYQGFSPNLAWIPTDPGTYTATAFGWESKSDSTQIFKPVSLKFNVLPEIQKSKSESSWVNNVPTGLVNSDNVVTWEYAYSKQNIVEKKYSKLMNRVVDLWKIYEYEHQGSSESKQKVKNAISKLDKFSLDLRNIDKVREIGMNFMIQEEYGKAVSTFTDIKIINELNNLEFQELPIVESVINDAINYAKVLQESKLSGIKNVPTGLVNTKNVQPKPTCSAGTELVNGVCKTIPKSNPTPFDNIPTGLVNTKNIQPKPTCGAGTELVNGKCQVVVDEPESKSSWFDNIPTGLVDTKNVKPEKTCFLFWCW